MINNYEELQSFQAEDYLLFKEMQEILKVDGTAFDTLESNLKIVENNGFIDSLNIEGIERWEKILNLKNYSMSLELRRQIVQSKLKGFFKLNANVIKNMMSVYNNGKDGNVYFENSTLHIIFDNNLSASPNLENFGIIVEEFKPAHLDYTLGLQFDNKIGVEDSSKEYMYDFPITAAYKYCGTIPTSTIEAWTVPIAAIGATDSIIKIFKDYKFCGTYNCAGGVFI